MFEYFLFSMSVMHTVWRREHIYNVENSQQVAQELLKLHTTNKMKFITLDIKDLYVNLPVSGIMHTTQFWLQKKNPAHASTQYALQAY